MWVRRKENQDHQCQTGFGGGKTGAGSANKEITAIQRKARSADETAIDAAYWQKTYNEMISDYRENPDEFARDYLGINLRWYQKLMLRLMKG